MTELALHPFKELSNPGGFSEAQGIGGLRQRHTLLGEPLGLLHQRGFRQDQVLPQQIARLLDRRSLEKL
ncbi:hypothetical protein D3C76_263050 [compost metagenome]